MKMTKRVFSVFLATLMALSALALSASAATDGKVTAGSLNVGDTFKYGKYPQSVVDDMAILNELAKIGDRNKDGIQDDGPITYEGVEYYIYNIKDPDVKADAATKAELDLYKGFSEVYNYDPGYPYAFRMEPITWRVLDKNANSVTLMAEDVLDGHAFNEDMTNEAGNEYSTSTMAAWLNNGFLKTAFTEAEQANILVTDKDAQVNPVTGTKGGKVIQNKVFLPSFDEITNKEYGFNKDCTGYTDGAYAEVDGTVIYTYKGISAGYYERDEARRAVATDFAKAHGVWSNLPDANPDADPKPDPNDPTYIPDTGLEYPDDPCYDNCRYWLRTPGMYDNFAAGVLEDGRVSTGWYTGMWIMGVRPMICVTPETVESVKTEVAGLQISINKKNPYYKQKGVKVTANQPDVEWGSTNVNVVKVDANGNLNIVGVGNVTIICKSADGNNTTMELRISYSWWQNFIRIILNRWVKF